MLFYDFEVFKHDWLVVVMDMTAKKTHVIINSPEELEALYKANIKEIWCGFNSRHYDQWILKAILCGFDPKKVNDYIIIKGNPGWKFSSLFNQYPLNNYDVMMNIDRGLKSFEGFMGNSIKETSVPFDIDRKLTEEEIAETVKYCKHDVEQTVQVFLQRKKDFEAHIGLAYLDIMIRDSVKAEDANLIAFENGLYDIVDDSFVEFTPDHIITNKIRWKYNPAAYSELADKTLNKISCNDPQIRALLEEAIGYCFYRRNELGKAFILTGDKSNGKSTFLSMVQCLLGDENIASLDLKELGDRFKTAELFGKLANIGDDIGDEFIANAAIFKKLVTGDRVSAERKGQNPFEFNNYSKFLFSANNIPRIKDKTGAVQRRLIIIPFDATFSASDPDFNPYIKHLLKTEEVMQYLINLGIQGLKRVLLNRAFTSSTKVQKELDEYEEQNNPILGFFRECEDEDFKIENEPTNKVYKRYQEYCIANSLQPMSNIEFSKQVNRILNFKIVDKKINGKKFRIFVPAD